MLRDAGVIAVLVIDDAASAAPLAGALFEAGVRAIELTLRTDAAYDAIREVRASWPELAVGVGTVLTEAQVERIVDLGVAFGVAPGLCPGVVEAAQRLGLPFAPGIATPSDIEAALRLGLRVLKYFPAESLGGLRHLQAMVGPYAHRDLQFIPLGGVGPKNAAEYLGSPLIAAIGGSWIAPRDDIRGKRWDVIQRRAVDAIEIARAVNH